MILTKLITLSIIMSIGVMTHDKTLIRGHIYEKE